MFILALRDAFFQIFFFLAHSCTRGTGNIQQMVQEFLAHSCTRGTGNIQQMVQE